MKRISRALLLSIIISLVSIMPVYADISTVTGSNNNVESALLTGEQSSTIKMINPRGMLISQAIVGISNEGKGKIGVFSQIWTHVPVDHVYMRIYLDKWENESWIQQQYFDVDFYQEDYPEDEMTMPAVSFNLTGYPTDYYYRLRCMYMVEEYATGGKEISSAQTNGVLITKTP